jgi:hypothetical protein
MPSPTQKPGYEMASMLFAKEIEVDRETQEEIRNDSNRADFAGYEE